jgi:hypothetical protein
LGSQERRDLLKRSMSGGFFGRPLPDSAVRPEGLEPSGTTEHAVIGELDEMRVTLGVQRCTSLCPS